MKLTDEQLQEIADKGAEAAMAHIQAAAENRRVLYLRPEMQRACDKEAIRLFAKTVIDLALSKMGEGEGDLVRPEEMRHENSTRSCENRAAVINLAHRQAMAALRAQMQSKIDQAEKEAEEHCQTGFRITKLNGEILVDRDQWKARAEKAEAEVVELRVRDGRWFDKDGCCRVCDGELPHGHTESCDIFKTGQEVTELRRQLASHEKELAALKQQAPADREALRNLQAMYLGQNDNGDRVFDARALEVIKAALAHKPQLWIPCSEELEVLAECQRVLLLFSQHQNVRTETVEVPFSLDGPETRTIYTPSDDAKLAMALARKIRDKFGIDTTKPLPTAAERPSGGKIVVEQYCIDEAGNMSVKGVTPTAPTAEKVPTPPDGWRYASEADKILLPKP